jgi:hypothetical protein
MCAPCTVFCANGAFVVRPAFLSSIVLYEKDDAWIQLPSPKILIRKRFVIPNGPARVSMSAEREIPLSGM